MSREFSGAGLAPGQSRADVVGRFEKRTFHGAFGLQYFVSRIGR